MMTLARVWRELRRTPSPRSSQQSCKAKFAFWAFCEVRTIPQASITLPCLPGLSFAGLREEQESERFRVVRTKYLQVNIESPQLLADVGHAKQPPSTRPLSRRIAWASESP